MSDRACERCGRKGWTFTYHLAGERTCPGCLDKVLKRLQSDDLQQRVVEGLAELGVDEKQAMLALSTYRRVVIEGEEGKA